MFIIRITGMLGLQHIIFILISFLFIGVVSHKLKNMDKKQTEVFIKFFTVIMLLFDPLYWFWEIYHFGKIDLATTLPMYFCSLCWICMPFMAFTKKDSVINRIALSYICTLNVVMGFFGLVFNFYPNHYPILSFVPLRSLIYHVFMLLIPAVLWFSGYFRPEKRDLKLFFIPVLALAVPAAITHILYGWDYCYMNGGKGTVVEMFSSIMPKPIFLITMFVFLYTIGFIFFFLPYFAYEKFRKSREEIEEIYYR